MWCLYIRKRMPSLNQLMRFSGLTYRHPTRNTDLHTYLLASGSFSLFIYLFFWGGFATQSRTVCHDNKKKKNFVFTFETLRFCDDGVSAFVTSGRRDTPSISSGMGRPAMWRTVGARSMETTDNESISMSRLLLLAVGRLWLAATTSSGTRISVS